MELDPAYQAFATPILEVLETVGEQITAYERQLQAIVRGNPTVTRLMTVPGIGYHSALAFYSTIEDPSRFKRSDDVGPYDASLPL